MLATSANTRPTKILVAEDQTDLREMIAFTLQLAGHEVISAADGQEAIAQAKESRPDLIILDLHMPRLTGYQVCEKLKARDEFSETPILIISAKGNSDEVQAGLDAGAQEYIRKPFELDHLMQRVDALLTNA
jgi:DNA-binding response OmpR family regulator